MSDPMRSSSVWFDSVYTVLKKKEPNQTSRFVLVWISSVDRFVLKIQLKKCIFSQICISCIQHTQIFHGILYSIFCFPCSLFSNKHV